MSSKNIYSLARLSRLLLITIGSSLILCFILIIILSYYLLSDITEKRQESISFGLLNSGLSLLLASEDLDAIDKLLKNQMSAPEVFAIEIRGTQNSLLYRTERESANTEKIFVRTYPIVGPNISLGFDDFDSTSLAEKQPGKEIGQLRISYSKHVLYAPIYKFFTFFLIISLLVIGFVVLYIRYFTKRLIGGIGLLVKRVEKIKPSKPDLSTINTHIDELNVLDKAFIEMIDSVHRTREELEKSLKQALKAMDDAKKAEEFKIELMRSISHDVKEPVHIALAFLIRVQRELHKHTNNTGLNDRVTMCIKHIQHLEAVVSDLFRFDQFESNTLINTPIKVNLGLFFENLESIYKEKSNDKGLSFILDTDPNANLKVLEVFVDSNKLTRIIDNLFSNAIKYTDTGKIIIKWRLKNRQLMVSVSDSGIGMSEHEIEKIFNRFVQLGEQIEAGREGRGLGLYYVKQLLETIKGIIEVDSKKGLGTAFKIYLPVDLMLDPASISLDNTKNKILSILVIDDNTDACLALSDMLLSLGLECEMETDAVAGFKKIDEGRYDIAFIDYHMPHLSGLDLAKRIKYGNKVNPTFLVCTTADASIDGNTEFDSFFHQVLKKPFSRESLSIIVEAVPKARNAMLALNKKS